MIKLNSARTICTAITLISLGLATLCSLYMLWPVAIVFGCLIPSTSTNN